MSGSAYDQNSQTCGCCEGIQQVTPQSEVNRPGLPALRYRVGTYSAFYESMLARLTSLCLGSPEDCASHQGELPLQKLTTRSPSDPAVALLDAWAAVGDVLTFYQERIANEGYLRTALQRRSVLELARLVGYRLRPGVAASAYLAYEMEAGGEPSVIPLGAKVQSVPGPGETAQTFETAADLTARPEWNNLKPRQAKPLLVTLHNALMIDKLYFTGTATNLKPNDPLLLIFDDEISHQVLRSVEKVSPVFDQNYTEVSLQSVPALVPILADWLQKAVDLLNKYLPEIKTNSTRVVYAPRLEQLLHFLLRILENLRLGNDPPVLSKLSRNRIYNLLALLFFDAGALIDEEPFLVFLRQALASLNTTRLADGEGVAEGAVHEGVNWGEILSKGLPKALLEFAEYASAQLEDPAVRQEVTCSVSNLIRQGRPETVEEEVIWLSIVDQLNPSSAPNDGGVEILFMPDHPPDAPGAAGAAAKNPQAEAFAALLTRLFRIPWEEGTVALAAKTLEELRVLAVGMGKGDVPIPPLDDVALRRRFSKAAAKRAAKAITRWQDGLNQIQKTQDRMCAPGAAATARLADLITPLTLPPAAHPASPARLARAAPVAFRAGADAVPRMLVNFYPQLGGRLLYQAWAHARQSSADAPLREVHALRLIAPPFGYNAPTMMGLVKAENGSPVEYKSVPVTGSDWDANEQPAVLFMDSQYQAIQPGSYVVIRKAGSDRLAARVDTALARPRTDYTVSAKSTRLGLSRNWWNPNETQMTPLRATTVFGQSENLPLADAPDPTPVRGDTLVLDDLYDGLDSGRWLVVSGERADIPGVDGVQGAELVMLLLVNQGSGASERAAADKAGSDGDTHARTTLTLSAPLQYQYKRATVTIYGNVVKATHGETHLEVLGSGDGSQPFQKFNLHQPPLTFVAADTPTGAASTLAVRVNDLLWHEADSFYGLGANQRSFVNKTDDAGQVTVIFGDGKQGARPPSGTENIVAQYRSGIGKGGNLRTSQLTQMLTRPLHAKSVTNPLPASGGADPDTRDQARRNAPRSVTSLGRLVSVQDYADFAASFAGIGKASAVRLSDGRRRLVHVTIAGIDDIPILPDSDLYHSLNQALLDYGDPHLPVRLAVRDLFLLVVSADISLLTDYSWEAVSPQLRAAMRTAFGFNRRELGQGIYLSEVIDALQTVPGVRYVDVQALDALDQDTIIANLPDPSNPNQGDLATRLGLSPRPVIPLALARYERSAADGSVTLRPAQIAYLTPDVPETLILNLREDGNHD